MSSYKELIENAFSEKSEAPVQEPLVETPQVETPVEVTPQEDVQPVVETPTQEVQTPTPQVETPQVESPTETPSTPEPTFTQSDLDERLAAREAEWKEANKPTEFKFADERAERINTLISQGVEIDEKFWKYQTLDLESVDISEASNAVKLIKQELTDVQGLSQAESELMIKRKYPHLYRGVDSEVASEEEIENYDDDVTQVGIDVRKSLESLKSYKDKVSLPKPKSNEPTPEQVAAAEANLERFKSNASQAVDSFKELGVQLSDDVKINVPVDAESVEYVKSIATNTDKLDNFLFDRHYKDGNTDFNGLVTDIHIIQNWESILKSVAKQATDMGVEKALKEQGVAPSLKGRQTVTSESKGDAGSSWLSQLRN